MKNATTFVNIPGNTEHPADFSIFQTRINQAIQKYQEKTQLPIPNLTITTEDPTSLNATQPESQTSSQSQKEELSIPKRAEQYQSQAPDYSLEQLILPDPVMDDLKRAMNVRNLEKRVFDDWGLRKIQPFPYSALNFYGKPGTGKSMAAHALAHHLNQNILLASYAQIESMYHGEGPKNVEALFYAAERDNAVLFIDEADSLLSKRLTNVSQGSEQAINSMRSQLLICLERFKGIVIFATNLIENYDSAFETRVRNYQFSMPDYQSRLKIWDAHLVKELPLAEDVSCAQLAEVDEVCGRDIRNAVINAALKAATHNATVIDLQDLIDSIESIKSQRFKASNVIELNADEQEEVKKALEMAS